MEQAELISSFGNFTEIKRVHSKKVNIFSGLYPGKLVNVDKKRC